MQCGDCPLGFGWNDPRQQRLFDPEIERRPCPVHFVQLNFNYEQMSAGQEKLRDAMRMLIDDAGVCQIRKSLEAVKQESAHAMPNATPVTLPPDEQRGLLDYTTTCAATSSTW